MNPRRFVLLNVFLTVVAVVAVAGLWVRVIRLENRIMRPSQAIGRQIGDVAPDFSLKDLGGEVIASKNLRGQPFLLVFASLTCPYCANLNPELSKFASTCSDLRILMIVEGDRQGAQKWLTEYDLRFPILVSEPATSDTEKLSRMYGIPGIPWLYVVDEKGFIASQGTAQTQADLVKLVSQAGLTVCP